MFFCRQVFKKLPFNVMKMLSYVALWKLYCLDFLIYVHDVSIIYFHAWCEVPIIPQINPMVPILLKMLSFPTVLTCYLKKKRFCLFTFREGKGGSKWGRETSLCGCLLHAPYWGPGLKPRHVLWLGIEPMTLWFVGHHSIHTSQDSCHFYHKSGDHIFKVSKLSLYCIALLFFLMPIPHFLVII